jgi:hypothetical protein
MMFSRRKWLFLTGGVLVAGILAWNGFIYRHHLRFVPEAMNVWWVRYVAEEAWGFGPGGNETGIIVFDMPEQVTRALETTDALIWLQSLPRNTGQGWQGRYETWRVTPISATEFGWADPDACPPEASDRHLFIYRNGCPSISGYMGTYGFPIEFDADVEKMVNEALFSPGAYYAIGRIGMLILIPARQRIVHVYNG